MRDSLTDRSLIIAQNQSTRRCEKVVPKKASLRFPRSRGLTAANEGRNFLGAEIVVGVFDGLPDYDYEISVTDNHSIDRTFALLRELAAGDPKRKVIRFSRNLCTNGRCCVPTRPRLAIAPCK